MPIYKRVEIWVLLVLVCAGIVVVLMTQGGGNGSGIGDSDGISPEKAEPPLAFTLQRAEIHPEGPLELDVLYRNEGTEEIQLNPPTVRVLNEQGGELPLFFLAFAPPPVAPAGEDTLITLRYRWTDADGKDLTLVIEDEEVPISLGSSTDQTAAVTPAP